MTQRLVKDLIAKEYKYIVRTGERDFVATKAEMPFKDDDDFDCYDCYKNETIKDLAFGTFYSLNDLVDNTK